MTIYVFSNAWQLTDEMVLNVKKDITDKDKIVLINRMTKYHLFKGMDNQIISFHRILKTGYKGVDQIKESKIRELIIFTRNHRQNEMDEEFKNMIKEKDHYPAKITYLIDPIGKFAKEYNYPKDKKPTMGPILILYLDLLFPDDEKVLVGFSSHPSQKDKQNLAHGYKFELKFMLKYCKNKKFSFRYSVLQNGVLTDVNPYDFFNKIQITHPQERVDQTFFSKEFYLI